MATILKLTKVKSDELIRVNFDNVAYYHAKGEHTVIAFLTPRFYENTITVKESLKTVDGLLGI